MLFVKCQVSVVSVHLVFPVKCKVSSISVHLVLSVKYQVSSVKCPPGVVSEAHRDALEDGVQGDGQHHQETPQSSLEVGELTRAS